MSSDIEIIENSHNKNKQLLNLLTADDSSDEEIICLDTVFKPSSGKGTASTILNPTQAFPNVDPLGDNTSIIKTDLAPQSKVNHFDEEEDVIDDILPTAGPSNFMMLHNALYDKNLPKSKQKERDTGGQPLQKKLKVTEKSAVKSTASKAKASHSTTSTTTTTTLTTTTATENSRLNPKDCTYPLPTRTFLELMVIVLKNAKCLLSREIWDYISGLFPYFEYHFDETQGVNKIGRVLGRHPKLFLRTTSVYNKKQVNNKKLVMLNPVMSLEINCIIEDIKKKKDLMLKSMYIPDIFDSLLEGTTDLYTLDIFHNRKPAAPSHLLELSSEHSLELASTSTGVSIPMDRVQSTIVNSLLGPIVDTSTPSSLYAENLKDVDVLDLVDEEERAEATSPKSTSSVETIEFDPKIVNCRTLMDEEVEADLLEVNDCEDASLCNENESGFGNKLMIQLDDMPLDPQNIRSSAFANTVWSNEGTSPKAPSTMQRDRMDVTDQLDPETLTKTSFPEIDKCVPKWKEIFPWMDWKPWHKKFFCTACEKIHTKLEDPMPVVVVEVNHPDDVFKVSKQLRTHAEKMSHKMALILENKAIISTLYFLLNSHFSEFSSIKDILTTFEDLFPSGVSFSQDTLKCTIQMLGEYLEEKIISKLKKIKKFSVITDPCAGLLVVRFVNEEDEPEEHIISSYARVLDKTPCEYLTSLGVLTRLMIVYVTNSRCEECARCKATKKVSYKNSTPLRLPPLDKYLVFLWRTKILKPFYSIGTTLCKLWVSFPHKFCGVGKLVTFDNLSKFPSNPDAFLDVFQNFEKFREIATSIYALTGNLEALGLQTIDVSRYDWMLDVFPILTNINILLLEIKTMFPFHKDFDNLFHVAEKLKLFCEKQKENLREKKIKTNGVDASDLDDLYNLVDLTVKEFQQPIYNKGRSVPLAYHRMTIYRNLAAYNSNTSIKHTFIVLYTAIKANYRFENTSLLQSLTNFLKENSTCERRDAVTVLNFFKTKQELTLKENLVYTFYRLMAYFPFQPAKNERCIYETKVYEYLFYRSAWSSIGPNIKDYLLTIIYELSGKQMLSEKDILTWWKEKMK